MENFEKQRPRLDNQELVDVREAADVNKKALTKFLSASGGGLVSFCSKTARGRFLGL